MKNCKVPIFVMLQLDWLSDDGQALRYKDSSGGGFICEGYRIEVSTKHGLYWLGSMLGPYFLSFPISTATGFDMPRPAQSSQLGLAEPLLADS